MVAARNSCTDNDPSAAPGWMAWKEGTRRMREIGRPMGLVKDDTDQVPSLIDTERKLRFLVSNTDEVTGLENSFIQPQNRSKRGPATDRAIAMNQGSLFELMDAPEIAPTARLYRLTGSLVSWYICVYNEGEEYRAELSCPIGLERGFFREFYERIILVGPDGPKGVGVRRLGPDDGDGSDSEFNISVSRK